MPPIPEANQTSKIIYLDNSATSFPKPSEVMAAMTHWLVSVGGSPGRSGHRLSTESARLIFEARESAAALFGAASSRQIIFTKNATEALNLALHGLLSPGDHVVTTSMEHNSVMRPLRYLAEQKVIDLSIAPCAGDGAIDPDDIVAALRKNTRLVVMSHASNVTGTIMPVADVAWRLRQRGILFLVDAAQTAGALPISLADDDIDLLAFTGHKSLLGPPGTGGLYLREGIKLKPLMRGGTGSQSEREEQPDFLPDSLEAGTLNAVGIAGLKAGIDFVLAAGVANIRAKEISLTRELCSGLASIPGLRMYGPQSAEDRVAVVSLNINGMSSSEVGYLLDEGYGIMARVGLHCAPAAHRTIGTFPGGAVRLSPGFFTSHDEIAVTLDAVAALTATKNRA